MKKGAISTLLVFLTLIYLMHILEKKKMDQNIDTYTQAIVPVVYYTLQEDFIEAQSAIGHLEQASKDLFTSIRWKYPFSRKDRKLLRNMDKHINKCTKSIQEEAYERSIYYLDELRYEWSAWCTLQQIDYPEQRIWDFECTMRNVVEIATDEMLGLVEWPVFERMLAELIQKWESMQQIHMPHLIPAHEKMYDEALKYLDSAVKAFVISIETGNGNLFGPKAEEVYIAYLALIQPMVYFQTNDALVMDTD